MLTPGDLVHGEIPPPGHLLQIGASAWCCCASDILGPERFDSAFRKFIRDWAFQHPAPSDFFRAMESDGGEDLDWFWRGWYMNNWTFDMAVTAVKGREVTIANLDPLVLPATVEIGLRGGRKLRVELPVETWLRKTSTVIRVDGKEAIASVVIDPEHALPDKDRKNNVWR